MKTIVFARNIALENAIQTNTHNYAIQFNRDGWRTFWIPKPATPLDVFKRRMIEEERAGIGQYRLTFLFNYGGRGLNSLKACWDLFPYFLLNPTRCMLRHTGLLGADIFFAGSLQTASLFKLIKPRVFIYNAHDAFTLYPGARSSIGAVEEAVLREATLTVTTAETTRDLLIRSYGIMPRHIINLGHGVDNSRYIEVFEPTLLRCIPHPRAVFLGTLDMQDVSLTVQIVQKLPDINFIFVGPCSDVFRNHLEAVGANNTSFLGPVYQDQLPNYLSFCDVGLIGYDIRLRNTRLYGSNPMKRYDYAAAGLQTVSVNLLEYEKSPSPMYIANTVDEFIGYVRKAITNPDYSVAEIKEFALANDWRIKYELLINHLDMI